MLVLLALCYLINLVLVVAWLAYLLRRPRLSPLLAEAALVELLLFALHTLLFGVVLLL